MEIASSMSSRFWVTDHDDVSAGLKSAWSLRYGLSSPVAPTRLIVHSSNSDAVPGGHGLDSSREVSDGSSEASRKNKSPSPGVRISINRSARRPDSTSRAAPPVA